MKTIKTYETFKPKPKKVTKEHLDYHDMIEYLEKKYDFESRGFSGIPSQKKEDHFVTYQRVMNDPMPFNGMYPGESPLSALQSGKIYTKPEGKKMIPCSKQEYDDAYKLIHDHYQRYKTWCVTNPETPYMDFWHYLCDINDELHNGSYISIPKKVRDTDITPEHSIEMFKELKKQYKNDKKMQKDLDILIAREQEPPKLNPWKGWKQQITDLIFDEFGEFANDDYLEVWVDW